MGDAHEQGHANVCDKRRPLREVKAEFPMVNWSGIHDEEDPVYSFESPETGRQCSDRAYRFMLWLRKRPEAEVAVGTHSAWLFSLLNTVVECADKDLALWFLTGELRSLVISFDGEEEEPER